jgi:8-amino-7-oxononanoate synthase
VGTIGALVGEGDTVYCDRLNHASLVDGCRLSGARFRVYRHERLEKLQRELSTNSGACRRLIVTDGVFSMDGDLAPLPQLCDIAEKFGAMLLVDEAHGTGVFGESGRGVSEHFGVEGRVTIRVGTLSKAVGALGGFVAGPVSLIDWLWNRARMQIYSTALPPAICAGATRAIELISEEPALRERLRENSSRLREQLSLAGVSIAPGVCGPIVPILLDSPEAAVHAASRLASAGVLVGAIRPPTVPRGTSRLRVTVSAAHSPADIDFLAGEVVRIVAGNHPA